MLTTAASAADVVTTMKSIAPTNMTSPSTVATVTKATTETTTSTSTTKEVTMETTKPTEAVTANATSIHGNDTETEKAVNPGEMVR